MDILNKKILNVIWHIETNRKVLGDIRTLDDVLASLNQIRMHSGIDNIIWHIKTNRELQRDNNMLDYVLVSLKKLV